MPLIRRLPKRGFNNARFHKNWAVINLGDLDDLKAGTVVNEQLLRESNLVRGNVAGVKILGNGELKNALTFEVDKVSASACEKIEKAGGKVTLRDRSAAAKEPEPAEGAEAKATAEEARAQTCVEKINCFEGEEGRLEKALAIGAALQT